MRKTILVLSLIVAVTASAQYKKSTQPAAPSSNPNVKVQGTPMPVQKPTADVATRIRLDDAWKAYQMDKAVFIDVRSKESYDKNHIKGALSIPGSQLIARFREIPPGKLIIAYCACSAEQSSGQAVIELNTHGVKNAVALQGGIQGWEGAGHPVETTR
jgi:rhodanese-related sulfurtransferase